MPVKIARSTPSTIVRAARAAGSQPHLASGFQGRCKIATLHADFGATRGMSVERATRARLARRERNRKGRKRPFVTTDLGRKVLGQIIPPLAAYIASKQRPPPQGLERVVHQVPHDELAL